MRKSLTARQLLELEWIGPARCRSHHMQTNHTSAAFGGQFLAQALAAAVAGVTSKPPHSLHAYFLRPGGEGSPIDYEVEALRDGERIASRRVSAQQHGKLIFQMHCSFAAPLAGFEHQAPSPRGLPGPEASPRLADYVAEHARSLPSRSVTAYTEPFPLEVRLIEPRKAFFELLPEPKRAFWIRMPSAAEIEDAALHSCLLAFITDYWLAGVAVGGHMPATDRGSLQILSLDHSIWFHRPARVDEWMLHVTDSPAAGGGRGLARGLIYDEAGNLLANTAQEALLVPTTAGSSVESQL